MLNSCERFSLKNKKWEEIERLNESRLNCASCVAEENYVYAFGGYGTDDFLSSIERFNIELNIWNLLAVRLPQRISNLFACQLSENEIFICGGLKPVAGENQRKKFEIESRVLCYNTKKKAFSSLKPLPFKKKLSNVIFNESGKIFCFVIEKNN